MVEYLFFTSSRSEYSILKNLLKLFNNKKNNFKIIVTGSHLSKEFGNTKNEINQDYKKNIYYMNIGNNINNNNYVQTIINETNKAINKLKPKKIILIGDRIETFSACISFFLKNIYIIHIHGGEVTHGSIDDTFRHSITKMSNMHFVTNDIYKRRVIQLGENPKTVFNYGSLSAENIILSDFKKKVDIEKKFKFKFADKNILVTYHPNTVKAETFKDLHILFSAIELFKNIQFIFTSSNNDLSGLKVNKLIKAFCKKNKNCIFIHSFGYQYYYSMMRLCDIMLGNSSSGIIEAPVISLPVINLGDRQNGRYFDKLVYNINFNKILIAKKIKNIMNKKNIKNKNVINFKNINLKKNTHLNIYKKICSIKNNIFTMKKFYDC